MKFAIVVFSAPHSPSSRRALRFAQAALSAHHEIIRLFFYQDGVHNGSSSIVTPQDEPDWANQWATFIQQNQLDSVVCISAALRRGILSESEAHRHGRQGANLLEPWQLSGLGQLHEAAQTADRLICFGDT
ncbi:sulfurtransferase complex subunit TusD [Pseudomonas asuensis]|uniref:sulfurtransferase complex subunit TusD n=1 Tax=Pseudomonas asuensis TaxID=1825787 RepID=UPI001667FFA1|nr:sulfurtransferase complex subunit TusD [Pseudomonas asuensis]